MTIIELYDKVSIENIAGALLCRPDRVILVGDKSNRLDNVLNLYRDILAKHDIRAEVIGRTASKNNLGNIVNVLSGIVESYDDCIIDLTGGEDLSLVAAGIIMNRYKGRVQCHRFNLKNDSLIDCDADGNVCQSKSFDISIEDNIRAYGGEIVTDPQREFYSYPWDFNSYFLRDIDAMWDICRKNPRLWNAQIGTLGTICQAHESQDSLRVSFDKAQATETCRQYGTRFVCIPWIFSELQSHGLISSLVMQDTVSFRFKNTQVKQALTVAGQALELIVGKTMMSLKDEDGAPLYHDVKVGVVIDWDMAEEQQPCRTINEIDVLAMKGSIPVFISCKNGMFDVNELYKLNTVAGRFGNKYAKKVLVSTEMDKMGDHAEVLRARMDDMDIRSVENVDAISDDELVRKLRSLWIN